MERVVIKPQKGPQELFLSSPADIVIFGGAAGGGKTWGLLIEPLRHRTNPKFGAVIFRRTYPEITMEGGIWDESEMIYPYLGGRPVKGDLYWIFPSGSKVSFAHLQYETDLQDYQGAQIPLIGIDQLEHFTEKMFFYLLSRNRSTSGIYSYLRATCNPSPDGWLSKFVDWWISEDGYANMERAGKIRWFVRENEQIIWGETREELTMENPERDPISVTFIPSTVYDNKILLEKDPGYLANLKALSYVDRMQLLGDPVRGGNWKVKPAAGKIFNRGWFKIVGEIPNGGTVVRRWDFAATEIQQKGDDPDYTASCLMLKAGKSFYILDVTEDRLPPSEIDRYFENISRQDAVRFHLDDPPRRYMVRWETEPGSSGKRETWRMVRNLAGLDAKGITSTGDKLIRVKPLAAQCEVGNVYLLEGKWNDHYLNHLHGQPDLPHDDLMDCSGGAFQDLNDPTNGEVETAPSLYE